MLNKGTFLQNPGFRVYHLQILQNQVTSHSNNRLTLHVSKDRGSVAIYFFVNFLDTSKIRDIDDANPRDKLFQTQIGKKMFQDGHNYIF